MQTLKKTWGKGNNPRLPKGEGPQPAKEEDRRPAANTRMPPRLQPLSVGIADISPERGEEEWGRLGVFGQFIIHNAQFIIHN